MKSQVPKEKSRFQKCVEMATGDANEEIDILTVYIVTVGTVIISCYPCLWKTLHVLSATGEESTSYNTSWNGINTLVSSYTLDSNFTHGAQWICCTVHAAEGFFFVCMLCLKTWSRRWSEKIMNDLQKWVSYYVRREFAGCERVCKSQDMIRRWAYWFDHTERTPFTHTTQILKNSHSNFCGPLWMLYASERERAFLRYSFDWRVLYTGACPYRRGVV